MQNYPPGQPVGTHYAQQQYAAPFPQSQQGIRQQVKFYKSGIFGLSSAAGRFERDQPRMAAQGWNVKHCAYLGTNFWLRRVIVVVYEDTRK
jgi:hypothetical protein